MARKLSEDEILLILDELYEKAMRGISGVSRPVEELAQEYRKRGGTPADAARLLIRNQVIKCGSSGFLTGVGGLMTLPVAIPANVGSVLYIQLRMVAAVASIGGFDLRSEEVRTLAYACLTGSAVADVLKTTGIKVGQRIAMASLNKVPSKTLTSINQKVGIRLIAMSGTKGAVSLGKMVPLLGGFIGGCLDVATTRVVGRNAYTVFIQNRMPGGDPGDPEEVIDVDESEIRVLQEEEEEEKGE
jgi:hypothetical protein